MMLRIHPKNPRDIQVEITLSRGKKKSWLFEKVQKDKSSHSKNVNGLMSFPIIHSTVCLDVSIVII